MAASKDSGFFYYYDKSSSSGTYWLVVRGQAAPLGETEIAKLQRDISADKQLNALRSGPSWRPAGNGRAYDFWLMIVDGNGKENPPDAEVHRVLTALGGVEEKPRQENRTSDNQEISSHAQLRSVQLGEQLRAMRHTLERAVEDVRETRKERDDARKDLTAAQKTLVEREKLVQSLEAEIGWTASQGKHKQSVANKELNNKEHTIRGFEYEIARLREEKRELSETISKFSKPAGTPMEAFRFAFENKLAASRLYFAQAATALFHRLANVMQIETHESGWMRQIRDRLVSDRIVSEKSKENHLIGEIHALRTRVIHDDCQLSKAQLRGMAKALESFEAFVITLEDKGIAAMVETAEPAEEDNKRDRKRDASLRDKRHSNKRGHG